MPATNAHDPTLDERCLGRRHDLVRVLRVLCATLFRAGERLLELRLRRVGHLVLCGCGAAIAAATADA